MFERVSVQQQQMMLVVVGAPVVHRGHRHTLSDRAAGRLQQGAALRASERGLDRAWLVLASPIQSGQRRGLKERTCQEKDTYSSRAWATLAYSTPHRALIGGKGAVQWAGRVGRSGCSKVWWKKIVLCSRLFSPLEALGEYRKNSTPTCCFPTTIDSAFGIQRPNRNHASLYPNRNQCRVSAITPIHVHAHGLVHAFAKEVRIVQFGWSSVSNFNHTVE